MDTKQRPCIPAEADEWPEPAVPTTERELRMSVGNRRPCVALENVNNLLWRGEPRPSNLARMTDEGTEVYFIPQRMHEDTLSVYGGGTDCKIWRSDFQTLVHRSEELYNRGSWRFNAERIYPLAGENQWLIKGGETQGYGLPLKVGSIKRFDGVLNITGGPVNVRKYFGRTWDQPNVFEQEERPSFQFRIDRWRSPDVQKLKTWLSLRLNGFSVLIYIYPLVRGFAYSQVPFGPQTLAILQITGEPILYDTDDFGSVSKKNQFYSK